MEWSKQLTGKLQEIHFGNTASNDNAVYGHGSIKQHAASKVW